MRICVLDDVERVALAVRRLGEPRRRARCSPSRSTSTTSTSSLRAARALRRPGAAARAHPAARAADGGAARTCAWWSPPASATSRSTSRPAATQGVVVSSTGGAQSPVVEHAWALILAALRDVPSRDASMRLGSGGPRPAARSRAPPSGCSAWARPAHAWPASAAAFGMDVRGLEREPDRRHRPRARGPVGAARSSCSPRPTSCRCTSCCRGARADSSTADDLRLMKPDAWLVNTSRGPIVDEAALVTALREQWFAGAALDVFDEEPLPADHPLRTRRARCSRRTWATRRSRTTATGTASRWSRSPPGATGSPCACLTHLTRRSPQRRCEPRWGRPVVPNGGGSG